MFKLFHGIFGNPAADQSAYPESLVKMATERALDATDARVRLLPGYAKKLHAPVLHAIDHVVRMVDALPAPVLATPQGRDDSPALSLFFYSATRMAEVLGKDAAWREYHQTHPAIAAPPTALLVAKREEKHTFGYALVDDKPMSDVAQTILIFSNPLLRDVCTDESETRRLLKRRAFDYLLTIALARIEEKQAGREHLSQRRAVMRAKLALLKKSSSFIHSDDESPALLQQKLDAVEEELGKLGADDTVLEANLAILADVLSAAETCLWLTETTLYLDKHNVLHDKPGSDVSRVVLHDLHDCHGRQASVLLLALPV